MSMFSSGKQVLSNYGEDLKDYLSGRIYDGVMNDPLLKKVGEIKKDAEEKLAEFKKDVKDGKYIFGDGEGLLHNAGEAVGKLLGFVGDKTAENVDKVAEGVSKFGNGFFGTDLGQEVSAVAKDVYESGKELLSGVKPGSSVPSVNGAGGAGSPGSPGTAQAISYGNFAPGASMFGMDRETAYQEYMANTAHQREVADLRAAGLNPVLGVSGSGASVVSGNAAGASSAQKGLDSGALVDVIGATAGLLTTIFTKNPSYGYMVKNAVSAGGDLVTSVTK